MKNKRFTPHRNLLLAAACSVFAMLAANTASADVILDFEVDANDFISGEIPGRGPIQLYAIGELNDDGTRTPIALEASTDYTINVSFAGNQALRVFASEAPGGIEDVAFLSTILNSTSPGSAAGSTTLDGVGGDYIGTIPYDVSSFFFPEDVDFDFFVLGAEQNLTDTSFLFTDVSFQFTTSSDMTDFIPVFSAVQVGGGRFEVVSVSEPGTLALLGLGLAGLGLARRKRTA